MAVKVAAKYAELREPQVKVLVVQDKWVATFASDIHGEIRRVSQRLTTRIRELAERYSITMPELAHEADALSTRVDEHLRQLGFVCN